jgi:hypothetical protein
MLDEYPWLRCRDGKRFLERGAEPGIQERGRERERERVAVMYDGEMNMLCDEGRRCVVMWVFTQGLPSLPISSHSLFIINLTTGCSIIILLFHSIDNKNDNGRSNYFR